jgi:serine protease Do
MIDFSSIIQKERPHGPLLTSIAIALLITGIILGMGIAEDISFSQGDTPSEAKKVISLSSTDSALSDAILVGQSNPSLQNATFTQVAKMARPAVVNISTTVTSISQDLRQSPFFDDPFFRRFFGEEFEKRFQPQESPRQQGTGSGVIIRKDGYIITNNHVVDSGDEIQVTLSDKRNFSQK